MIHPAGTFPAEVVDHGIGESKSGTPQVVVKFITTTKDGSNEIWGYFALTDKAAEHTIKKVRNMGFIGNDIEELNDGQCCVGNPCSIQVVHEEFQGKVRAKVGYVNSYYYENTHEIRRSSEAAAKARMFNGLLHKTPSVTMPKVQPATESPGASTNAAPAPASDPAPTDDDIPF